MSPPADTTGAVLDRPAPAAIDPRIRARRIAVRRSDARKRLRRLIAFASAMGVLAAVMITLRSPLLDVDRITVSGADHTGVDVVRAATGIARHVPMIDVDTGSARSKLLALPWVADALVTRHWPGTVEVRIKERTPVAAEPAGQGGFALIDATGRVLGIEAAPPAGVVQLAGLPPAGQPGTTEPAAAAPALSIARSLPASLLPRVSSIVITQGGDVDLRLVDAGSVRLGAPDDLPAKFLAALTVLEQVDLTNVCAIDVRVPTAPSLTRGSPCL